MTLVLSLRDTSGQLVRLLAICSAIAASTCAEKLAGQDWVSTCRCEFDDLGDSSHLASAYTFSANAIFLDRSNPDSLVLMQDTTDPSRQLNANDFGFNWRAGWEASVTRELSCGDRLSVRFMSLDAWHARAAATTNSTLLNPLQINTNPPTFAPEVQTIGASYFSGVHSLEVNYELALAPTCKWLAGFRYIELDEYLSSDLAAIGQTFTYDISTRNRLSGFQTGGQSSIPVGDGWTLDAVLTAGIYHNSAGHTSTLETIAVTQSASDSANRTAFAGEIRVSAAYEVTEHLAVRFGYALLWLETVALASDQIPATDLFTGTGIAPDGGVFYQGAFAGLEYRH